MVTSSDETAGALLGLSNDLADAVERAGGSVVAVHARRHVAASGVVWRPGVVVAADHTIERDEGIKLTLPDGGTTVATLVARDSGTDLAVLKVEGGNLAPAAIGNAGDLRVGHIVLAVARPGDHGLSASWGAVSALGGPWRTWSGGQIDSLIRPDLTLYPGFSGGPLIDARGQVVGINTSGLSRNVTLTIPASTVDRVVEQLLTRGRISRGYLGIAMQPVKLPQSVAGSQGSSGRLGLIVVSVESGGPAEAAGILVGDVLLSLEGQTVADTESVQRLLDPERIGTSIQARVLRGGVPTDVALIVGERPWKGE